MAQILKWISNRTERQPVQVTSSLGTLLDASPDAILELGLDGIITYSNQGAREMFRDKFSKLLGLSVEKLVDQSDRRLLVSGLQRVRRGETYTLETGLTGDIERTLSFEITLRPIHNDGVIRSISFVGRDSSDRLQIIEDLTKQRMAALNIMQDMLKIEERFRQVVEAAPNAMLMVSRHGQITLLNRQTEILFGYSRDELLNQMIEVLIPLRFRSSHPAHRNSFLKTPSIRAMGAGRDLFGLRKDGTEVPIEIGLNPIETEEGISTLASIIDITERKRSEDTIKRNNEILRKTCRELDEFAYIISHDLKAPLRGIGSIVDWLCEDYPDQLDDEGKEHLNLLKGRVERMHKMIDSILGYSRLGRENDKRENVDLKGIIKDVLDVLNPPEHIEVTVDESVPTIYCSPIQVTQIFQNLIGNAIRYIDKDRGIIRIRAVQENEYWHFTVEDNGPGISTEHFERIFQIFQTLLPRDKRESTGIGLTIVKKLVELQDGKIWVESELGIGSKFHFTVPNIKNG